MFVRKAADVVAQFSSFWIAQPAKVFNDNTIDCRKLGQLDPFCSAVFLAAYALKDAKHDSLRKHIVSFF